MIYVTERAKQELKRLLDAKVDWPSACLRLVDRGQGRLGLGIDTEAQDDQVVEYEGEKLLVFTPELDSNIKIITLDVEYTSGEAELVIDEEIVKQSSATGKVNWFPLSPALH